MYEWLQTYSWLCCSPAYDGVFCLPCILFENDSPFERLDKLFKSPLSLWTSANCTFSAHEKKSNRHEKSLTDFQLFKTSTQNRMQGVDKLLSAEQEKRIKDK